MTRIIHAELLRLVRRRTVVALAVGSAAFALVSALAVFASAKADGPVSARGGATLADLTDHGGGTQAFATGASFAGLFVFVTFIALIATEFSGGTFRSLLMRDPHRLRVILGKLLGILVVVAGFVAVTEALTFGLSLLVAPGKDIATGPWFGLAGLGAGLHDYVMVMAGVTGWAIFGTTLAVVFRSAPLALGVGFAWAGPFENIVSSSWTTGLRFFPGRVLAALIQGGTPELGVGRAALTTLGYTGLAAAVALLLVSRRDVTA